MPVVASRIRDSVQAYPLLEPDPRCVCLMSDNVNDELTNVARDGMVSNRCAAVSLVVFDPVSGRYVTIPTPRPLLQSKPR